MIGHVLQLHDYYHNPLQPITNMDSIQDLLLCLSKADFFILSSETFLQALIMQVDNIGLNKKWKRFHGVWSLVLIITDSHKYRLGIGIAMDLLLKKILLS